MAPTEELDPVAPDPVGAASACAAAAGGVEYCTWPVVAGASIEPWRPPGRTGSGEAPGVAPDGAEAGGIGVVEAGPTGLGEISAGGLVGLVIASVAAAPGFGPGVAGVGAVGVGPLCADTPCGPAATIAKPTSPIQPALTMVSPCR
jgi:hypothetical protein